MGQLVERHAVAVVLEDISIEHGSNLHASNVTEESFDPQRLLLFNNCHEVKFKELYY